MHKNNILDKKLEYFNDTNFKFDEGSHSYTYINQDTGKPIQIFESVSGFISQFKTPFDAQTISRFVAKSRKTTQEIILEEWKIAGDNGKRIGTETHSWIEDFYNDKNPDLPTDPDSLIRVNRFKELYESKLIKFSPLCQELKVFSRKWGIAGTLDGLFELSNNYYVGDYKTNKDFTHDKHPKGRRKRLLPPFDDLWDNDLNGYSIQISTYRLILQEEIGLKTNGGFLVCLGPTESNMYKTLDLMDKLKKFLESNNFGIL